MSNLHLTALSDHIVEEEGPMTFSVTPPSTIRAGLDSTIWREDVLFIVEGGQAPFTYQRYLNDAPYGSLGSAANNSNRIQTFFANSSLGTFQAKIVVTDATNEVLEHEFTVEGLASVTRPQLADVTDYVARGSGQVVVDLKTKTSSPNIDWSTIVIREDYFYQYGTIDYPSSWPGEFTYTPMSNGLLGITANLTGAEAEGDGLYWVYDTNGVRSNVARLNQRTYDDTLTISYHKTIPDRVQFGEAYTVDVEASRASFFTIEKSANGSTNWTSINTTSSQVNGMSYDVFVSSLDTNYWMRVKAVSGSETVYTTAKYITFEQQRTTGIPTSVGNASSQHIFFDSTLTTGNPMSIYADLTIPYETADKTLGFWAIQCYFQNSSGVDIAGAHLGLQLYDQYPNNHAVNWGGYLNSNGSELAGTVSSLPSAQNNPNTRNYDWIPGRSYRLVISHNSQNGNWYGSIIDLSNLASVIVRELIVPGATQLSKLYVVFSEQFTACDAESREAIWKNPTSSSHINNEASFEKSGYLTYQSHADGGCTNTSTYLNAAGDGWIMKNGIGVNRPNDAHQGVRLALTA